MPSFGLLRLYLQPKDGSDPLVFMPGLMCEFLHNGSTRLYNGQGETALLYDQEVRVCVEEGGGATPLSLLLLSELVRSKFEPEN